MVKRFVLLVFVVGILTGADKKSGPAVSSGRAVEGPSPSTVRRMVFPVQQGNAKDVAAVLAQHFGKETVQISPTPGNDYLVISGPPKVLVEVEDLLKRIDRRPHMILIQVLVAEVAAEQGADGKAQPEQAKAGPLDLSGPWDKVVTRVQDLRRKGTVGSLKTVRLTALEGQKASVQSMERKPIVIAMSRVGGFGGRGGPGPSTSSITYNNAGLMLSVTPQVLGGGRIALDLKVEDARIGTSRGGPNVGVNDKGEGVPAAEFVTSSLGGRLIVTPGRAAGAEMVTTRAKAGKSRTVIAVTARVLGDDTAAKGK